MRKDRSLDKTEFAFYRKKVGKTQREMAQLLGTSIKAIHSYEQGWRRIPVHVERQLLFLVTRKNSLQNDYSSCWEIKKCPEEQRAQCPAWEFQTGDLCWFINGTICEGYVHNTWKDKMENCRFCKVFTSRF